MCFWLQLDLDWRSNNLQVSTGSGNTILTISSPVTSDYSSEATSPPESIYSFDSSTSISSPVFGKGPMARDQSILDTLPEYIPRFSPKLLDEISLPMSG